MKTKLSFVTNSSSTSFIIGDLDKANKVEVTVKIKVNLLDFLRETLTTLEDLDRYFDYWEDDSVEYQECKKIIKKGGVVYILRVATDCSSPIEWLLCNNGIEDLDLPDNIVVIYGKGGF